jgi:hypothetical protein
MDSPASQKAKNPAADNVVLTGGEILSDGNLIELVARGSAAANDLALLLWDGEKLKIAPHIEYSGMRYKPVQLHKTIRQALRLPAGALSFGSAQHLFSEIAGLFEPSLPRPESALASAWCMTTWLAEFLSSPPPLVITGRDMNQAVDFFRLLQAICRRAFVLTDLSRASIRNLPMELRPALLVNQPDISQKIRSFWKTSNYRGLFVPGNGGMLLDVACSKALYLSVEGPADKWCDGSFHIALPPALHEFPLLGAHQLDEIARHFQPRLLRFRLEHYRNVGEPRPGSSPLNLPACIEDESDVVRAVTPLLQRQQQDALAGQGPDVREVAIEVLWPLCHDNSEIGVRQLTELVNTRLRDHGEILQFSAEEIGWRLRSLGLYRHRNANGMSLQFSREHRMLIHQAARQFGLKLSPIEGCPDCNPPGPQIA